jgi:hypothetical protein
VLERSVARTDAVRFAQVVDVPGLSVKLVDQIFTDDQLRSGPPGLKQRVEAYLKPGLADNLQEELLAAVKAGGFAAEPVAGGVLHKLWSDAGGQALVLQTPVLTLSDAQVAVAEVPLVRTDSGAAAALRLTLENQNGVWRVTDAPNVREVLTQLAALNSAAVQAATAPTRGELAGLVQIQNVRKMPGRTAPGTLLVGYTVRNMAPVTVRDVTIGLVFADAAGVPLKTAVITENQAVPAGAVAERTATLALDTTSATERYVAQLPLAALNVQASVQSLRLPSGKMVGFGAE